MTKQTTQETSPSRIAWRRVAIAALLSELGVMVAMTLAMVAYMVMVPGLSWAQLSSLGEDVGYYVAPAAGAVTTFLAVLWAVKGRSSDFLVHGVLVGVAAVVLSAGFFFGARREHRVMYLVSYALRLVAGAVAGAVSTWRFDSTRSAGRSQTSQPPSPKATAAKA